MIKYLRLNQLSDSELAQFRSSVELAFPPIIHQSPIIKTYWSRIEKYFPDHQVFAIDTNGKLIGSINTIPIFWNKELQNLPNDGWDWLVKKGIEDFERNKKPNSLGGLQIIVTKEYQGKGYSKELIAQAKVLKEEFNYKNLFIPIRPTFKHLYAEMKMTEYIDLKKDNKIYDPWIRTHIKNGATIIKVCENSMNVSGSINFWEKLAKNKIIQSGELIIEGALNPININMEKDVGEYREPNIWISY